MRFMGVVSGCHHQDNNLLALLAIIGMTADKEKEAGMIQIESGVIAFVLQSQYGICFVACDVTLLINLKNRIRSIFVLENYKIKFTYTIKLIKEIKDLRHASK